ncbi:MAG: CcmD family protein [FCB group bacterium]|jgi:hypothetical protein
MQNFLQNNSIYIVLMIVLLIWAGIALYLLMVDRKISKLELFLKDKETETHEV